MENQNGTGREDPVLVGESWEYFKDYLDNLDPHTKAQYMPHFINFLRWVGMDTDQLYSKHLDNLDSRNPRARLWLGKKITDYQKHMRDVLGYITDSGKATTTVTTPQKGVIAFFKASGIEEIPMNGGIEIEIDEIPNISHQQLKALVNGTGSLRNKALFLFMKDTGLRASDIAEVKHRDMKPILDNPDLEFFTWELKPVKTYSKTKIKANPCLGPESLQAIRKWVDYKKKKGFPTKLADAIFCLVKGQAGYTSKTGVVVKKRKAGDPVTPSGISVIFGYLIRKEGLHKDGEGRPTKISGHSARKFFQTNLETVIPSSWINKMTGRKGSGTYGIYSKPDEAQLLELYSKAYHKIQLFGEEAGYLHQQEELTELREKLEDLEAGKNWDGFNVNVLKDELEERDQKIEELTKSVESLIKYVSKLREEKGE